MATAALRGVDISDHRVRQLDPQDISENDLIVAVDAVTAASVAQLSPSDRGSHVPLLMSFAPGGTDLDVPDPYMAGTIAAYEHALGMIEAACGGLAEAIVAGAIVAGVRQAC